eukprot:1159164-Pelagomonas_calceolata.AAC.15
MECPPLTANSSALSRHTPRGGPPAPKPSPSSSQYLLPSGSSCWSCCCRRRLLCVPNPRRVGLVAAATTKLMSVMMRAMASS